MKDCFRFFRVKPILFFFLKGTLCEIQCDRSFFSVHSDDPVACLALWDRHGVKKLLFGSSLLLGFCLFNFLTGVESPVRARSLRCCSARKRPNYFLQFI
ncbi:hypothetical protein DLM75_07585 [Leptospira stimsonii]|uniref:Uncharacterized protein n=1 Tax=Leptospira stimsonii TaxID=2202203 RepID=A0A396ZGF1_9LEPT|nr:hypothetical protein DLM75_07585 [Leptospira stimsonii]